MTELTQHNYAEIQPDKIREDDTILWQRSPGSTIPEVEVTYVAAHNSHAWYYSSGKHFLVARRECPDFSILTRKDRHPDYGVFVKVNGSWSNVGEHHASRGYINQILGSDLWEILEPKDS